MVIYIYLYQARFILWKKNLAQETFLIRKIVWAGKSIYQIDFVVHDIDLDFYVRQHRPRVQFWNFD